MKRIESDGGRHTVNDQGNRSAAEVRPSVRARPDVLDTNTAEHHKWGEVCDAWRLLDRDDLSVIEERVPAGGKEEWHYHTRARQLFYILEGSALMRTEHGNVQIAGGGSVEIRPGLAHQILNPGTQDLRFLVISSPTTRGDRTLVPGCG